MKRPFPEFFGYWKAKLEIIEEGGRRLLQNRAWTPDGRYRLPYKPEEVVRQGFISYLLDEVGIDLDRLEVESALGARALNEVERRRRCDLVVHGPTGAVLIVEFKRWDSRESLLAAGYSQARIYARELRCGWVMVCNGRSAVLFKFDNEELTRVEDDLPPELLALRLSEGLIEKLRPPSCDHSHFDTSRSRQQPWAIEYLVGFQNFILRGSLVDHVTHQFTITKDLGCETAHYRNAGGNETKGVAGIFRFYEARLEDGRRLPIGLSIVKYDDPAPGYLSKNILTVSLERKAALEMSTYSLVRRVGARLLFRHNGEVRAGRSGLGTFAKSVPDLTDTAHGLCFGSISMTERPDAVNWTPVVLNILRYAIERERMKPRTDGA